MPVPKLCCKGKKFKQMLRNECLVNQNVDQIGLSTKYLEQLNVTANKIIVLNTISKKTHLKMYLTK